MKVKQKRVLKNGAIARMFIILKTKNGNGELLANKKKQKGGVQAGDRIKVINPNTTDQLML